eukprot:1482465-Pleurochrysis_carterae.AAC.4
MASLSRVGFMEKRTSEFVHLASVVNISIAPCRRSPRRSQIDSWWVLSWLPVTVGEPVRSFLHSTHELFATSLETVVISVWIAVNERRASAPPTSLPTLPA